MGSHPGGDSDKHSATGSNSQHPPTPRICPGCSKASKTPPRGPPAPSNPQNLPCLHKDIQSCPKIPPRGRPAPSNPQDLPCLHKGIQNTSMGTSSPSNPQDHPQLFGGSKTPPWGPPAPSNPQHLSCLHKGIQNTSIGTPSPLQDLPQLFRGSKTPPRGPPALSCGILSLPSPSTNRSAPFLGKIPAAIPARSPGTRIPAHVHTRTPSRDSCSGTIPSASRTRFSPPFHDPRSPFSLWLPGVLPRPLPEPAGWQRCRAVINGAALPIPGAASRALASTVLFIYFT